MLLMDATIEQINQFMETLREALPDFKVGHPHLSWYPDSEEWELIFHRDNAYREWPHNCSVITWVSDETFADMLQVEVIKQRVLGGYNEAIAKRDNGIVPHVATLVCECD